VSERDQDEKQLLFDVISRFANELMDELGITYLRQPLHQLGWRFGFDRARRRVGQCTWRMGDKKLRRITISRFYALSLSEPELEDVIRHEIAHAIDYETRNHSAHDAIWRACALKCGADASRLHTGPPLNIAYARYVGVCPACGSTYPFFRKLRRTHACASCCELHNGGRYSKKYALTIVPHCI